jgi:hypothetical protein
MSRLLNMARLSGVGALLLAVLSASAAMAQEGAAISWQRTGQSGAFNRIFTPASGALFVRGAHHKSADLARSDDGGATWTTILEHTGGGGISIDPTDSNRLLAGFHARGSTPEYPGRVVLSQDGGATWTDITHDGMQVIQDVAFGIGGRTLYLVDLTGVWRAGAY